MLILLMTMLLALFSSVLGGGLGMHLGSTARGQPLRASNLLIGAVGFWLLWRFPFQVLKEEGHAVLASTVTVGVGGIIFLLAFIGEYSPPKAEPLAAEVPAVRAFRDAVTPEKDVVGFEGDEYFNGAHGFSVGHLADWHVAARRADVDLKTSDLDMGDLVYGGVVRMGFILTAPDGSASIRILATPPIAEPFTEASMLVWKSMMTVRLEMRAKELGAELQEVESASLAGASNVIRFEFTMPATGRRWRHGRVQALHDQMEYAIAYSVAEESLHVIEEILESWRWRRRTTRWS